MMDSFQLAQSGFRQKMGTYLVMALLVAATVAGYLVVSAYWADATNLATASVEPVDFPYVKAVVVHAYHTNPEFPTDPDVPVPPRKYAPLFNEVELDRIRKISGVQSISVALSQDSFTRFGAMEYLSIETESALWDDIELVSGRLPRSTEEVLVPDTTPGAESAVGDIMTVKTTRRIAGHNYLVDGLLAPAPDPEPTKHLKVVGTYQPKSTMMCGLLGWLPISRVDDYPILNPKSVPMDWPVPNVMFLGLERTEEASSVIFKWGQLYPDNPFSPGPLIPPPKAFWTADLPDNQMRLATGEVATPVYGNTVNAFALGAIGIFAGMFISFLDRRRELGIMKTVGIDNAHTSAAISAEVVMAGTLGTVVGVALAMILSRYAIRGISGNPISIPWHKVVNGTIIAALIQIAATYVPRMMAKQGTVMELLYGRPIPIIRKRA